MGISCDSVHSHRAWATALGGLPYPELSDFHPKGKVTTDYGLWNEERGAGNRAVFIIDTEGVIKFRETYPPGQLPVPEDIISAVQAVEKMK